jgi:lysophospholipase L1-like esterase
MVELEEPIKVPEEVSQFEMEAWREKTRIVAIGDSITACGSMKREERWTGILEGLLGEGFRVVNAGIGGTSSSLGLYRWRRDVAPMEPRAVVICFLLNDSHIRFYECSSSYCVQCTSQRMEANMRAMFDLTRSIGAEPVLWTPPPVPTWGTPDTRMRIQLGLLEQYESILERVCAQREVPVANNWREFPEMVEEYPGCYFKEPDGYHSTVHAQPMIAKGIRDALAERLPACRPG